MSRFIKITAIVGIAVSIALFGISCDKDTQPDVTPDVVPGGDSKPKILVKVGDVEIGSDRVETVYNRQKSYMQQQGQSVPPQMEQAVRDRILNDLVNIELIMQDGKRQSLLASEEEINTIYNQEVAKAGGEEQFNLRLMQTGKTPEQLRDSIREWLTIQKVMEQATANLPKVEKKEAKKFFEENKARFAAPETVHAYHILKKIPTGATPEQEAEIKKQMEGILKSAKKKGADFSQLATQNSECQSAQKGGDLGSFGRGQMVKEFEDVAFGLKVGKMSGLVKTQFGYHIIKVTEHTKGEAPKFRDMKDKVTEQIEAQNKQVAFQEYVNNLPKTIPVVYTDKKAAPPMPPPTPTEPQKKNNEKKVGQEQPVEQKTFSHLELVDVGVVESQVVISGITDLPDGAILTVYLDVRGRSGNKPYIGVDKETTVSQGKFKVELTPPQRKEFKKGPYEVSVLFTPRAQSSSILKLVGKDGENLSGNLAGESGVGGFNTMELVVKKNLKLSIKPPSYTFQKLSEFKIGTPERTLAEFVWAWKNKKWDRMTKHVQKTWLSKQNDPKGLLKAQYGFKTLKGFEITNVEEVGDAMSAVTFIVHYEFTPNQISKKKIKAMVISEQGQWGVNPSSTLREEDSN